MLFSYIVKKRIRQTFDDVNNHRWDEVLKPVAPNVHHRFAGAHALGGERHDKETLRRWFEPCLRSGTAPQRCSTATLHTSTMVSTCSPCDGARCMRSICLKIRKKWPAVLPPKQQLASKKLSPNKL